MCPVRELRQRPLCPDHLGSVLLRIECVRIVAAGGIGFQSAVRRDRGFIQIDASTRPYRKPALVMHFGHNARNADRIEALFRAFGATLILLRNKQNHLFVNARITREMTELLVLNLVDKAFVTDQMVLTVGYDIENLTDPKRRAQYHGEVTVDRYGRQVPKHAHGTANLGRETCSTRLILEAVMELYDRIVDPELLVRRVYVTANHVREERGLQGATGDGLRETQGVQDADDRQDGQDAPQMVYEQLDLFTDYEERERRRKAEEQQLKRERSMQQAVLQIQGKYGKNAILKGMNLEEGAMTRERNAQIGGHKA